jgi:hypothetical protein
MFRGYEGRFGRDRKELAEMTILLSYLLMSLASCGAALWVLLRRKSRMHHHNDQQHWDPM